MKKAALVAALFVTATMLEAYPYGLSAASLQGATRAVEVGGTPLHLAAATSTTTVSTALQRGEEWAWFLPGNRILEAPDRADDVRAVLSALAYLPILTRDGRWAEVVYQGRKSKLDTLEAVNEVAKGKTYTAQASIDAGLTDEIGYIDAAIEKARTLGGISEKSPPVVIYHVPKNLFSIFGVSVSPNGASAGSGGFGGFDFDLNISADSVRQMLTELGLPKPAYLMHP